MIYEKATGQKYSKWNHLSVWGAFTRYLEIGENGYPARHVDVFENGNILRYDIAHWIDNFGMLADAHRDVWGPALPISEVEFNDVWERAEGSEVYAEQLSSDQSARLGSPPWLGSATR